MVIHLLEKIKKLPHVTAVFLNVERISSLTKVIKYHIKSYSLHQYCSEAVDALRSRVGSNSEFANGDI